MFNLNNFEYSCTKKCHNKSHGNAITAAVTKFSIPERYVIRFIAKKCKNFTENCDDLGRNCLHISASTNKCKIAEFLLSQKVNDRNYYLKRDNDGLTALHRSIFYGSIGVSILLKNYFKSKPGESCFDVFDDDCLIPLNYCCRSKNYTKFPGKEVLVFGKNKNYNLGNSINRDNVDNIDYFRKNNILITKADMNFYHSMFLSDQGVLYTCGHGKGGRLGNGIETTMVEPKAVSIKFVHKHEKIINLSAGKHHSLILTDRDIVYSAGLNQYLQLGHKTQPEHMLAFKEISNHEQFSGRKVKRIIAEDFHSMVIGNKSIWIFGLNVGQFGTIQESIIVARPLPLPFSDNHKIKIAECSNAAICVYTADKDDKNRIFYVFHKRKMKYYKNPLMEDFVKISVSGGELLYNSDDISKTSQSSLKVIVLTIAKNFYIWYDELQQFVKCFPPTNFNLEIDKMFWNQQKLIFLIDGNVYKGLVKHKISANKESFELDEYRETYLKKELSKDFVAKLNLKRVSNISSVFDVRCDSEDNIIALADNTRKYLRIPEYESDDYDFSLLLEEACLFDTTHDVVFNLNFVEYPAHKFIVCSRCEFFEKLIINAAGGGSSKTINLDIENLTNRMFECILQFMYCNEFDIDKLCGSTDKEAERKKTVATFVKILIDMEFTELKCYVESLMEMQKSPVPFKWFSMNSFPEFYDVTIKLESGSEIQAHKCVLISRLEYFKMMFFHTWAEKNEIQLHNFPVDFLKPILDFAYTNDPNIFRDAKYSENFMYSMVSICDQFLINDVKNIFELMICQKIFIRNCGEILDFAFHYNCEMLKTVCMEFISNNLSRILESTALDSLDMNILNELSKFYRSYFDLDCYRIITPDSSAIDDEALMEFIKDFDVEISTNVAKEEALGSSAEKRQKVKTKPILNKLEVEKRNFEREALKSLSNDLNGEKGMISRKSLPSVSSPESPNVKRDVWKKIDTKKEVPEKKKLAFVAVKTNEIMKTETKNVQPENFVCLKTMLSGPSTSVGSTPVKESEVVEDMASLRNSFTLADFTPNIKQKGKKNRRMSENEKTPVKPVELVETPSEPETPEKQHVQNVWKMSNISLGAEPTPLFDLGTTPVKSEPQKSAKKANPKSSEKKKQQSQGSWGFSDILKTEQKEKQSYEMSKSKSLHLTQIEEKAIEELKMFYNVGGVFDENISIYRKNQYSGKFNFAIWQYQQKEITSK